MESRLRSVGFGLRTEFYRWYFWCHNTAFTGLYPVLYILVHLYPVNITLRRAFPPCNSWMSNMEFFEDSLLEWYRYYHSFTLVYYYRSSTWLFFVGSCTLFCLIISFMNLSSDTFLLISSRLTGRSCTALHWEFLIITSSSREAITVSSNGYLYFGISLDGSSAWLNFADRRNSILKL